MSNYTKTFGTGVIPTFNITPGQGNTSWKYAGDESAAILDEYLAERALAKAEQQDTFTNKTIPSIKKLLFPEADDVEAGIADMVVDEIVNPDRITDEDTGKFYGSPSAATDAILEENAFDPDKPDSWLEMGIDKFKGLFGNYDEDSPLAFNYEDGGRVYYADGTNEEGVQGYSDKSFYDSSGPISEEVSALQQRYMNDLNPTGMEAFKQMSEQFSDVAPEQIMDIIEDKFPQYMNDPTDPFAGMEMEGEMAYGGRVGLQAGGLPFTPFMAPNYAAQYYNQNFNVPTIVPPAIQPIVDPDANNSGATGPMPPEGFGSLGPENIKPLGSKGPEDRMEGFRPQDNPLSFSNPANQTTMKFVDGKLVYDNVNPYLRTGVVPGDEVPIASPLFAGLNLLGGLFGFDQKQKQIDDEIAEHNLKSAQEVIERQKKEQEERDAAAAQAAAEQAAADEAAQTLKETYAANQYSGGTGSGDNKPSPGTGTFSGGNVSGFTGGGQSPHSSMSSSNSPTGVGGQTPGPRGERGGAGGKGPQGRSRCFVKGTMVEMADGTTKEITTITPGMETRGGTVEFVLQGLPVDIWDYKGVKVSGTHWVVEDNQLIAVEDSKHGIKTDMFEPVYSMKTSKQRMWVKGIEFGDFESGTDEDWEPYFEKVRQDLNKKLHEKRKENQQSDERV